MILWQIDDGDGIAVPVELLTAPDPDWRLLFYDQAEDKYYALKIAISDLYELVEVEIK